MRDAVVGTERGRVATVGPRRSASGWPGASTPPGAVAVAASSEDLMLWAPVRRAARGFVMGYVLFVIALCSVVVAGLSRATINADAGRRQAEVSDTLVQQVEIIRAKIVACGVGYPAGNNGLGYRTAFPATPGS